MPLHFEPEINMCERKEESFPECEDYWHKDDRINEDENYDEDTAREYNN